MTALPFDALVTTSLTELAYERWDDELALLQLHYFAEHKSYIDPNDMTITPTLLIVKYRTTIGVDVHRAWVARHYDPEMFPVVMEQPNGAVLFILVDPSHDPCTPSIA